MTLRKTKNNLKFEDRHRQKSIYTFYIRQIADKNISHNEANLYLKTRQWDEMARTYTPASTCAFISDF